MATTHMMDAARYTLGPEDRLMGFTAQEIADMVQTMAKEKRHHLKLLKLEAFLRIKYPEALAEYNLWWEISRQLEEAVGETK